jgi:hypothetical protein
MGIKLLTLLLVLSFAWVRADEPGRPLEAGTYLLVYNLGSALELARLKVSFAKNPDGSLAFSCVKAAASPAFVFQHKTNFQFSVFRPGSWNDNAGGDSEMLCFVGAPDLEKEMGVYEGTVSSTTIGILDGAISQPVSAGRFLLYKVNP